MPAKSQKQKRFMAAVANNPKFAKKAGVPQSVGEEFMKKSKGYMGGGMMKRYAEGDMIDIGGVGGAPGDEITRGPRDRAAEIEGIGSILGFAPALKAGVPSGSLPEDGREVGKIPEKKKPVKKSKPKAPVKKMGGGKVMKYFEGGSTRGPNPSELDGAEAKDQAEYMNKIMDKMPPQSKALATRGAKPKSKPKAPTKKMGEGKIEGYKKGGKVRGCGMAKRGVRPAKMVTMKGA